MLTMKIAMMTNNYKPFLAGVSVSVERLAQSLRELGHQVVVFAPSYGEQEPEKDVVRYRALLKNVAGGFSLPDSMDPIIEREFKKGDFQVIHVHHPIMIGHTARYLSKKYHLPLVFTYHTRYEYYLHYGGLSGLKRVVPAYLKHFTGCCDMILTPTPRMKAYIEQIQPGAEVSILPTGLPVDSFCPDREKAAALRRRFIRGKKYLFCTVSRLAREKNMEFLFRAIKILKNIRGSDFQYVLIGDGPYRKKLERAAAELGIAGEVVFAGKVPNQEVKNYCSASDLFLFSSLSETQGIVLIESMAVGTPVLALMATGTEDVVVNGKNGYMTNVSEMEFALKLMDILEKKELDILRRGAYETAERFHCEVLAHDAVKNYRRAIVIREQKEYGESDNRNEKKDMVYSG